MNIKSKELNITIKFLDYLEPLHFAVLAIVVLAVKSLFTDVSRPFGWYIWGVGMIVWAVAHYSNNIVDAIAEAKKSD